MTSRSTSKATGRADVVTLLGIEYAPVALVRLRVRVWSVRRDACSVPTCLAGRRFRRGLGQRQFQRQRASAL